MEERKTEIIPGQISSNMYPPVTKEIEEVSEEVLEKEKEDLSNIFNGAPIADNLALAKIGFAKKSEAHQRVLDVIFNLLSRHDYSQSDLKISMNYKGEDIPVPILNIKQADFLHQCNCRKWVKENGEKDWSLSDKTALLQALEDLTKNQHYLLEKETHKRRLNIPTTDKFKNITTHRKKVIKTPLFISLAELSEEIIREKPILQKDTSSILVLMPNVLWLTGGYVNRPQKYHHILKEKNVGAKRKARLRMFLNYATHMANVQVETGKDYFLIERNNLAQRLGMHRLLQKREQKKIDSKIEETISDAISYIKHWTSYLNIRDEKIFQFYFHEEDFKSKKEEHKKRGLKRNKSN